MDTSLLTAIVIAIVAIIPAIWAMINQFKKDKNQEQMAYSLARETSFTSDLQNEVSCLLSRTRELEAHFNISKNTVDDLWEKMYEKPVIVRCQHCDSPNVITNLICTQCGAPLK